MTSICLLTFRNSTLSEDAVVENNLSRKEAKKKDKDNSKNRTNKDFRL